MRGRVAIVTGAGRGIGRGILRAFAAAGAQTVAVDLDGAAAEAAAAELAEQGRPECLPIQADVADYGRARLAVAEVLARFGRVDVLVNNAGIAQRTPFLELTEAEWDRVLAVNLKGAFNWSQAVAPAMLQQGWGRIIAISSVNAKTGGVVFPAVSRAAYAAAKAGLLGLTRSLARELAPNVTVNAICPGLIATELTASSWRERAAEAVAPIPAGRPGQPEDIAQAVLFLASEGASYITGEVMDVNGGFYID
jgi:3-oxoacyl-[acyl-carrier protein] reductase